MPRLFALMMMLSVMPAVAGPAHDAHVHGQASLNVALDGAELTIEMDTPADNLLGFEHLPRGAAEKSQAGNVLTLLSQPKKLFRLNPEAQCLPDMPAIDAPLLLGRPVSGEHNDISATFVFRCAKPAALSRLDVLLFEVFPRLTQARLQFAGPTGQRGQTLSKAKRSLSLK